MVTKFYKNKTELKNKLNIYCSTVIKHIRNEFNLVQNDTDSLDNEVGIYRLAISEEDSHFNEIKFNIPNMTLSYRIGVDDEIFTIFRGDEFDYKNEKTIKRNIIKLFNYGTCSDFKTYNPNIRKPRKIKYDNTEFKMFIDVLNEYIMEYKIPYTLYEPYYTTDADAVNEFEDDLFIKYHSTEDIEYCNCFTCRNCSNVSFWGFLKKPYYPVVYFKKPETIYYTEITEKFECPISMLEVDEGYITICKHKFSKEGLIRWLKECKKDCPLCRTKLSDN